MAIDRRIFLAVAAAPALARAHKEKPHADSAVRKEQKPWGIAGDANAAKRTIRIRMLDTMRFEPERLELQRGETVLLAIRNDGRMLHEIVIGTKQELDAHAALMLKFPGMEHDEPYMAHVSPGRTGRIVWRFNRSGEFEFACLIAGHYQAGMKGVIHVR